MKLTIWIFETGAKILIVIIKGMFAVWSMAIAAIASLIGAAIDDHRAHKRQLQAAQEAQQKELAKQEAATRKAEIAQSLACAYSAEANSYSDYACALELKAKHEKNSVKRHKLMLQAATAYRRAEQLASKCPDYVRP